MTDRDGASGPAPVLGNAVQSRPRYCRADEGGPVSARQQSKYWPATDVHHWAVHYPPDDEVTADDLTAATGVSGALERMREAPELHGARHDPMRNIEAGDPLHRIHDLPTRAPMAGAEIDGDTLSAAEPMPDGRYVRIREIADVYVITYGRSIGGRIVAAEQEQFLQAVHCGESRPMNEIRFGIVTLTNLAIRTAAGSVGVPQPRRSHTVRRIVVRQLVLNSELCATVGTDGPQGRVLDNRQRRAFPVDRARRRKHDWNVARCTSQFQQTKYTDDIVAVVPSEAAPQTDKSCSAPLPGASLPGTSYPSQPRPFTQETTFGNLAQL